MNEQIGNRVNDKKYIKLTPFKDFVLENFPFIEADFDAITNYQLLCKVIEYLNNVIANQNTVQKLGTELVNAYNYLYEYVNNFFNNLDVQEEINNKLDDMVEQGTLQEIIADYLNSKAIFGFDNVASMTSSTNLINGSFAKTLGYYNKNDDGGALYKIRTITNDDVVDNMFIIPMSDNSLIAELITSYICPEMLGAKGDGTTNDTLAIEKAFNSEKDVIMLKNYKISHVSIQNKKVNIKGKGTIIADYIEFDGCNGYIELNGTGTSNENFLTIINCDNTFVRGTYKNIPRNALMISDCNNIDISANVYNCGLTAIGLIGYLKYPKGANIHDCYIEKSGQVSGYNNAIYINSSAETYYYEDVNVSNCNCIDCGCGGIFISADRSNITNCCVNVTGTVTGVTAHGIRIHDCKFVNVSNCEVKNSARQGIEVNKAGYINISNCIARNCYNAGFHTLYDTTEAGRYYGAEANKNVTFNSCIAIDNGQAGNNQYPGFLITSFTNISLINCMVNSTGEIKQSRGVLGASPTNFIMIGCIFTNCYSNAGTNVTPDVGYYIDGNGPHFNMKGTYKSSLATFGISSLRQTSINENSDLAGVIKFLSSLCDYLAGFGFFNTTNN